MFHGKLVAEFITGDIQYFILKFLPVLGLFPFLYDEANKICWMLQILAADEPMPFHLESLWAPR